MISAEEEKIRMRQKENNEIKKISQYQIILQDEKKNFNCVQILSFCIYFQFTFSLFIFNHFQFTSSLFNFIHFYIIFFLFIFIHFDCLISNHFISKLQDNFSQCCNYLLACIFFIFKTFNFHFFK